MINEKNKFLTVSWLSGLLSAEIFIGTGEWGVQMPPLTSENSHFLRSGPHEAILVMFIQENAFENVICEMASILSRPQCVNTSWTQWLIWVSRVGHRYEDILSNL